MIVLDNQTNYNLNIEQLQSIIESLTLQEVELTLCDDTTIQEFNREYRQKDKPTDVLSFPLVADFDFMPIGSIVISIDRAKAVAKELGHSVENEIALLLIHGLLHLLGYDHESDEGQMRAKELEVIQAFNLPSSLIVRTEDS